MKQTKMVSTYSIYTATLGENEDTSKKRIESHKKGYLRGSPDLIINNLHKHYTEFAIEFKNPKGNGVLSYDQSKGPFTRDRVGCQPGAAHSSR